MKIRKLIPLLFVPVITNLLIGCCECKEPNPYEFKFGEMSVSNIDNTGKTPIEVSNGDITRNAYGIRLKFSTIDALGGQTFRLPSSGKPSGCCPSPYWSQVSIISFRILTINDFDDTHPAGTDVSEYFRIFHYQSYKPVDNMVNENDILYDSFNDERDIIRDILLMKVPAQPIQQFRIEIELSDKRSLVKTTPILSLK